MTESRQVSNILREAADEIVGAWRRAVPVAASDAEVVATPPQGLARALLHSIAHTLSDEGDAAGWTRSAIDRSTPEEVEAMLDAMPILPDIILARAGERGGDASLVRAVYRVTMKHLALLAAAYARQQRTAREEALTRTQVFAQDLSHELKSPLNAARAGIQMVKDPELGKKAERREELLDLAERSINRAFHSIDDVRRVEHGDFGDQRTVRELIEVVTTELAPLARQRGVTVDVGDLPEGIAVPGPPVELALRNLVTNAIKYCDPDKPRRWVRLEADTSRDCVILRVSDNGVGIAAPDRERIFRRFERADSSRAEGSGLGLAIANDALERIDARIEVESQPGNGSTFEIRLRR